MPTVPALGYTQSWARGKLDRKAEEMAEEMTEAQSMGGRAPSPGDYAPRPDVPQGLPVEPDVFYMYVDRVTGYMGNRSDLVIMALTAKELGELRETTGIERVERYANATRYFGDVAAARYTPKMGKP